MGLREPLQESNPTSTDALARAGEALMRGSWQEARALFETSLSEQETPEALEGLGVAASWLDDAETSENARERAYRAYRERGDRLEAARVAMSIAMTHIGFMGAPAVARGWLRRAKGLLEDLDPTPIHGWIALGEGFISVVYDKEAVTGRELSEEAAKLGRSLGDVHLEMMATGQTGLCMVLVGDVKGGMPLLDEAVAAAIGGELTDPSVITNTCCYMITACQRVRDYDRAAQWARKAMDYCRDWTDRSTFSYCRSEAAATLIWQGKWAEAEHELRSTLSELGGSKPSIGAMASARLADLRRRQGRFDDARALLDEIGSEPLRGAFGPEILLSRALLALDRGDHAGASDLAERYLRRVPREVPTERLDAVAAFALARLRAGEAAGVDGALVELKSVADGLGTEAVRATAEFIRGVAALTSGELDEARRSLEDAVDLYERSGGVQESGRARLELARVLGPARTTRRRRARGSAGAYGPVDPGSDGRRRSGRESPEAAGRRSGTPDGGRSRPHRSRSRDPPLDRTGPVQPRDRVGVVPLGAHRRAAHLEHLREGRRAREGRPGCGHRLRAHARPGLTGSKPTCTRGAICVHTPMVVPLWRTYRRPWPAGSPDVRSAGHPAGPGR
jgi:predicted negative regulator of RcsB-dependent stress response